jgi:hypothetical protein
MPRKQSAERPFIVNEADLLETRITKCGHIVQIWQVLRLSYSADEGGG